LKLDKHYEVGDIVSFTSVTPYPHYGYVIDVAELNRFIIVRFFDRDSVYAYNTSTPSLINLTRK